MASDKLTYLSKEITTKMSNISSIINEFIQKISHKKQEIETYPSLT